MQGAKGPGLILLIPVIQQAVKADLREFYIEVPQQTCITKDNAPISIDFLIYSKVFEPSVSVTAVTDFRGASQALAATTLRAVIGDIPLDDVLAKREEINNILRTKLDEVTHRWGVKVTSVEIREIVPPRDIQDAMNRQMSAERNRRAVITESEGTRQASINVAEGDKQSTVLRAEGDKQSAILRAEGERRPRPCGPRAYGTALTTVFGAASGVDEKTMQIQYLQVLRDLAGLGEQDLDRAHGGHRADQAHQRLAGRRPEGGIGEWAARGGSWPRSAPSSVRRWPLSYLGYVGVVGSRRVVAPAIHDLNEVSDLPATPAALGLPYESVRFTTDDGVTLDGWLVEAERDTRAAVILLHGFSWHRLPWLAFFVPWLRRRYHVLQFDFRGHGASDPARSPPWARRNGRTWPRPCACSRGGDWGRSPCTGSAWAGPPPSWPRPTCRWPRWWPTRRTPTSGTRSGTGCATSTFRFRASVRGW